MQFQELNVRENRTLLLRLLSVPVTFRLQEKSRFMDSRKNKRVTDKPKPGPALSSVSRERRAQIFPNVRANRFLVQSRITSGQEADGDLSSALSAGSQQTLAIAQL